MTLKPVVCRSQGVKEVVLCLRLRRYRTCGDGGSASGLGVAVVIICANCRRHQSSFLLRDKQPPWEFQQP
jgi:hypothetical protein